MEGANLFERIGLLDLGIRRKVLMWRYTINHFIFERFLENDYWMINDTKKSKYIKRYDNRTYLNCTDGIPYDSCEELEIAYRKMDETKSSFPTTLMLFTDHTDKYIKIEGGKITGTDSYDMIKKLKKLMPKKKKYSFEEYKIVEKVENPSATNYTIEHDDKKIMVIVSNDSKFITFGDFMGMIEIKKNNRYMFTKPISSDKSELYLIDILEETVEVLHYTIPNVRYFNDGYKKETTPEKYHSIRNFLAD